MVLSWPVDDACELLGSQQVDPRVSQEHAPIGAALRPTLLADANRAAPIASALEARTQQALWKQDLPLWSPDDQKAACLSRQDSSGSDSIDDRCTNQRTFDPLVPQYFIPITAWCFCIIYPEIKELPISCI